MRKWPYLLIVAGICLLLYPTVKERYYDWEQRKLLDDAVQIEFNPNETDNNDLIKNRYEQLSRVFNESAEQPEPEPAATTDTETEEMQDQAIAVIAIDKIDLKLPVLEGATKANMKIAAAHMTETAALGEVGNAAIAAHRARTKGRLFNRLNELEIGDAIAIQTRNKQLNYTVFKISVVEPTDLSVLNGNNDDSILTLITCDPLVNPTHRLIIHAKL
ncbi:class D sortase [Cohnella cholangitidis]|uniref:Class D sortase n=1 Tax=Cohnella cholangitidis TaxID=2598458 RepID=A0A7G5C528_9BACL|nr:class D sortase [Cohnella cholangitidis]QMV44312.1 class D sortase [Cohnella cholangitidis]